MMNELEGDIMLDVMNNNKYVMLIGRVLLVLAYIMFIFSFNFAEGPVDAIASAAKKGIPAYLVWMAEALKFTCGFAIIFGIQTRPAALALIFFTLCTAFIFHFSRGAVFFKEISMIGGFLILAAVGPGELSLERYIKS